jgi:uncharacterized membrane protein
MHAPGLLLKAVQRFARSVDSTLRPRAMTNAMTRWATAPLAAVSFAGALACAAPANANVKICNRMSYVAEAAIAVQERGAAASRGWFRVDPGQCRSVLQGALTAEEIFIHTRVNPIYGPPPPAQTGDADFCVADGNFVIGGARNCRGGQKLVRFSAVKPSDSGDGSIIMLAEAAEYDDTQARDAGIQRLLVAAGYDASPVDGLRGEKTDAALRQFLIDNKLSPTAAGRSDFFDVLLDAAQKPGNVFTWCNDTPNAVMAAIGVEDRGLVVTRGWYRVDAGKCLRPDVTGQPKKLYSFAEAVDGDGRAILQGGKPLTWGGDTTMCTRSSKFEIADQGDCAAKGLTAAGFAAIDLAGRNPATVRFK